MKGVVVMIWRLGCAMALTLVPGLAWAQGSAVMSKDASRLIAARLVDPGSLVLRNTRMVSGTSPSGTPVTILCGEYNAKNGFGGYAGFQSFVYEPKEMQGVMTISEEMVFMSQDGRSDFSLDSYKNMSISADKLTQIFNQLGPYLKTYWGFCRRAS